MELLQRERGVAEGRWACPLSSWEEGEMLPDGRHASTGAAITQKPLLSVSMLHSRKHQIFGVQTSA